MLIRPETPSDFERITEITRAAFENQWYSRQTEVYIIPALRAAGALILSLVAEIDGAVVGHVAFSPIALSGGDPGWYGAGPLSVVPECQRQGIGKALMREGLEQLKALGARGCVLVGDPSYYRWFGFRSYPGLTHEGVPPEYVMALPFGSGEPDGAAVFHPAFLATE